MSGATAVDRRPNTPSGVEGSRAWLIAAAASAANVVTFGVLFSFGVFLTPIAQSFGTSTGPVASLLSGAVLFYYVAGAAAGWLSDRYGIRPVVTAGAISLSLGLALSARADELWQLYVVYIPLVGFGVGCCYAPLIGTVGRWFERRRTMAMAVLLVGVSAGTLLLPLLSRRLIDSGGWRSTFNVFAVLAIVVLGATALVVTDPPGDRGGRIPIGPVLRSRRLRGLYLSVVLIGPGFYAPIAFFNDYAVDVGVGGTGAAALVGFMGAASLAARLVFGVIGDRLGAFLMYRLGYALMLTSSLVWLAAGGSYAMLVLSAVFQGVGWAAWVTSTPLVLAEWFGTASLGGIVGLFYTGVGVGALLGPAVSGFVIDQRGYTSAIALVTVLSGLAFVVALVSTVEGRLTLQQSEASS